ncbi:MAG: TIGR02281 family clan AA aspartic protease [Pseudomonadota bacterium]
MWRYVVGFALVSVLTVKGIEQYTAYQGFEHRGQTSKQDAQAPQKVAKAKIEDEDAYDPFEFSGRKARIKMDRSGHFITTAKMNGRKVTVLVDTGATSVAINKSTAKRLGIFLKASDFKYTVNTANGATKAASAYIKRIEIGRVTVKNVRAAVLSDKALDGSLLGMTFLGQLKGFEVKNRQLILTQ